MKQRMLSLLEYHFSGDPVDGPEITDIKQGTGYADLASDLLRLAKLYKKHRARVKLDVKNFVSTDEASAGRAAHAIMSALGEVKNQDQKAWTGLVPRAWTLLAAVYGEVAQAGSWLYRFEDAAELFPSLYVLGRSASVKGSKAHKGEVDGDGGGDGNGDGDGGDGDGGDGESEGGESKG